MSPCKAGVFMGPVCQQAQRFILSEFMDRSDQPVAAWCSLGARTDLIGASL